MALIFFVAGGRKTKIRQYFNHRIRILPQLDFNTNNNPRWKKN
jgi:hypothetical protein